MKVQELIGVRVFGKEEKVTRDGKYAGQKFWILIITCESRSEIKKVHVFDSKIGTAGEVGSEEIMNDVKKSNYVDKRYLFYCYKRIVRGGFKWDLLGWKELKNK